MGSAPTAPAMRRVAIYGRVSTEHEAQLSAFENQQVWYEGIAHQHEEWAIVDRYYDEGITGTAAKKRPAFMRMLADAQQGKFDLIVTREVCRFARNTVDTLTVTRELSKLGIEVYFIQDNIWTMDGDGELRLTIMATLAQEESRKISERVRAGQKISREKGVLYGTGNILGYDRVEGTYQINPEQAYTVRKIFELYDQGWGYKRICAELVRLGCKNAHGNVEWKVDRIGRILRNATYKGYIGYNKSHSDGYLTQKRVNHRDEEFRYCKGNFEPIVSEELWDRCAALREKKIAKQRGEDGRLRKFGRKEPQSVWCTKLRCSCGSSFRRFLWHKNADGRKTYGYECYRQKREVSKKYLDAHGLDGSYICHTKSIPFWHIDLMALCVFRAVWRNQKDAVLLACQMLEECSGDLEEEATGLLDDERPHDGTEAFDTEMGEEEATGLLLEEHEDWDDEEATGLLQDNTYDEEATGVLSDDDTMLLQEECEATALLNSNTARVQFPILYRRIPDVQCRTCRGWLLTTLLKWFMWSRFRISLLHQ